MPHYQINLRDIIEVPIVEGCATAFELSVYSSKDSLMDVECRSPVGTSGSGIHDNGFRTNSSQSDLLGLDCDFVSRKLR